MIKTPKLKINFTDKINNRLAYGIIILSVIITFGIIAFSFSILNTEMNRLTNLEDIPLK